MTTPVFLAWLWQATWQAAVLILLVLLLQAALSRWLTGPWRYALWIVVVARLATPLTPASPTSVFNITRLMDASEVEAGGAITPSIIRPIVAEPATPTPLPVHSKPRPRGLDPGQLTRTEPLLPIILPAAWLLGFLFFSARVILVNARLGRALRPLPPVTDLALLDLLCTCRRQLRVRRRVRLVETDLVSGPALRGVFRPTILLPRGFASSLSADDLRWSLLHELAHVKRWDAAVNWLLITLQAVHWFNPLVWFAFHRLRGDRELACDALVLKRSHTDNPRSYGEAILRVLESAARSPLPSPRPAAALAMAESVGQLQRRLTMIAHPHRPTVAATILGWALLISLGCTGLTDRSDAPDRPGTVIITYDINDLVHSDPDYQLPQFPFSEREADGVPSGNDPAAELKERESRTQEFIDLIQSSIDPDHWLARGGKPGRITQHNGILIVKTTARNHGEIGTLLDQLREQRGIMVTYETRFILVDKDYLDELELPQLKELSDPGEKPRGVYLNEREANFLLRAMQANRRASIVATPRITTFNGQRAYVVISTQTAFIKSVDMIEGTDAVGFIPRIATVNEGVVVGVRGTVSADRKYVTLEVHPKLSKLNDLIQKKIDEPRTTEELWYQVPDVDLWEAKQTVSVPDKGTYVVVLGKTDLTPKVEAGVPVLGGKIPILNRLTNPPTVKEERTVLFLIKPTIIFMTEKEEALVPPSPSLNP